jgi:AcrR family transcriptional regulator
MDGSDMPAPPLGLRERRREATRREISYAALSLASKRGLEHVRVPEVAAAAGVSTRTFNNYFESKEAAIVWPATQRAAQLVAALAGRAVDEPLADALVEAFAATYETPGQSELPAGLLRAFRDLVAREPTLRGEYLKATDSTRSALAGAIAERLSVDESELYPHVLAAMVVGAEREAVLHAMRDPLQGGSLADTVRTALRIAVAGLCDRP